MDHMEILQKILQIYESCAVYIFPINCFELYHGLKIKYIPYSSLTKQEKKDCLFVSQDAFILKKAVYYNDHVSSCRLRFTLVHELAHIVLGHQEVCTSQEETQANNFASNLLAPRLVIHQAGCKNQADISSLFQLSKAAGTFAFNDYCKWRKTFHSGHMSLSDQALYRHFYDYNANLFVYRMSYCKTCKRPIYNKAKCSYCSLKLPLPRYTFHETDPYLTKAENAWLYGEP